MRFAGGLYIIPISIAFPDDATAYDFITDGLSARRPIEYRAFCRFGDGRQRGARWLRHALPPHSATMITGIWFHLIYVTIPSARHDDVMRFRFLHARHYLSVIE